LNFTEMNGVMHRISKPDVGGGGSPSSGGIQCNASASLQPILSNRAKMLQKQRPKPAEDKAGNSLWGRRRLEAIDPQGKVTTTSPSSPSSSGTCDIITGEVSGFLNHCFLVT
jgi:hypothetical protein